MYIKVSRSADLEAHGTRVLEGSLFGLVAQSLRESIRGISLEPQKLEF